MDATLCVDRTGIPWRYPPHDLAPRETVHGCFAACWKEGVFDQLGGLLRRLGRKAEGRDGKPSARVPDARSVKTSSNVPAAGRGIDAGRKSQIASAMSRGTPLARPWHPRPGARTAAASAASAR
ncbi:hypothetical protein GCM10010421_09030 [Streptomyces glaucus]|uniref:Transposase n=1 Tax=Streptomyces glaucus TaxID=284029 RepID=A0ABN3J8P1_9ACTN